jgi:hypothetical protein
VSASIRSITYYYFHSLGTYKKGIVDLIDRFLKTPIYDKDGNDHRNTIIGINPLSLILLNCFLHQKDLRLEKIMNEGDGTSVFYYARYADYMVFGVLKGENSPRVTRGY